MVRFELAVDGKKKFFEIFAHAFFSFRAAKRVGITIGGNINYLSFFQ